MFRQGVGIVLKNEDNQVLLFKRTNVSKELDEVKLWQFPQGGIDAGEDLLEAAKRELREETGIKNFKVLKQMKEKVRYRFPDVLLPFGKYEGQEQTWFLMEFTGAESEIDFETHPEEIEFCDYNWVSPEEAIESAVEFKKDCYRKVIKDFFNV